MKSTSLFGLVAFWIINFGISWWNARVCGKTWVEVKQIGGWERFMNWMGAVMSASGFTWCYLFVLLLGAYRLQPCFIQPGHPQVITQRAVEVGFDIGYVILIPGMLFSGMMIWLDSLVKAWRQRDLPSIGVAAWNTYAQVHNTYSAFSGMSGALGSIKGFFSKSGDDDDDSGKGTAILLLILLIAFALLGGILTTWGIISHYAATEPLPARVS